MKKIVYCFLVLYFGTYAFAEKATRTVVDENGAVFNITVEAPKKVDLRVFSEFGRDEKIVAADEIPVNISGYHFVIVRSQAPAGCKSVFQFTRRKPTILGPKGTVQIDATYAEDMGAVFFPVSGNVDVQVFANNRQCSKSKKPKNTLDTAGCYFPGCFNNNYFMSVLLSNPSPTEPAVFVGSAEAFFINP